MHALPTEVPQFLGWQKPMLWILSGLGLCQQPANCGIVKDMELTVPEE
jgi:hypothetical protein